jgi:succinate dehydrogenase / fumarate reductase, membrane anchor subunit
VRTRGWRLTLQSAVGIVTLVFFLLGTITLITFHPVVGALGPNCIK